MNYEDLKVGMEVKLVTDSYPKDGWNLGIFLDYNKGDILVVEGSDFDDSNNPLVFIKGSDYYVTLDMIEPVEEVFLNEFLNTSLTPFKDLTDEQKLLIIREKMRGNVEKYLEQNGYWIDNNIIAVHFDNIYRTKPVVEAPKATPLDLPWQFIKPEYKWAAMDENGVIAVYIKEPYIYEDRWEPTKLPTDNKWEFELIIALNIPTEGIVWNKSLTKRGEFD